jgi:predicted CoA-binding protein
LTGQGVPPLLGDADRSYPDASVPVLNGDGARELLRLARRIAIVGASAHEWRASHSVMEYLVDQGYECVPVTPMSPEILGRRCFATLEDAVADGGPFDIVDVFRRPEHVPDIARSAVATGCRALWLQIRVVSWDAARIAHEGGLSVVMDRCTAMDHRRLREIEARQSGA